MFCPNCGKSLPDNVQFCSGCGAKMPNQQPMQAQQAYQPYQPKQPSQNKLLQTLKGLSKKQIITIACAAVAVIVALFLIFFFACGGCDSSAQTAIVNDYVEAVEKGNALTVAKLYHPAIIDGMGYDRDEYDEFLDDEDPCYYYYCDESVKKSNTCVYSINEYAEAEIDRLVEQYGDYLSKDDIAEYKMDALSEVRELEEEGYEYLYDEFDIKASDIAIGYAEVEFRDGSDATYTMVLIKDGGKWYIAYTTKGSLL